VIPLVALAAGAGAGCWLVVRALAAGPERLDSLVSRLGRPGVPVAWTPPPAATVGDRTGRLAARLLAVLAILGP
jgi:glucose-6-phosphate dehydrogenase assembly protein OpcA